MNRKIILSSTLFVLMIVALPFNNAKAQTLMVRMAKLQIDSAQLEKYKSILKEEIETSIRLEPGVITLYAVSDQKNPTNITIFETYASAEAYQSHIHSPQFLKYKTSTVGMVKSLQLIPCNPVALGKK